MNICVFGASSDSVDPVYFEAAEELGALLARDGHCLIYGGGREGLMGACARGLLRNGGNALGIAPRFFDEPGVLLKEGDFVFTETVSERKCLMEERADAFIALPGGIGTFEEFFETLTLKQLGRHNKPMALINTMGYFDLFIALLEHTAKKRFMSADVLSLFTVCATPSEAVSSILLPSSGGSEPRRISDYSRRS